MLRTILGVGVALLLAAVGSESMGQTKVVQDKNPELRGRLVRIDHDKALVYVRVGEGEKAQERKYQVGKVTKYYGKDNNVLADGMRHVDFRQGTEVWFREIPGPGNDRGLMELRLGSGVPIPPPPGGKQ